MKTYRDEAIILRCHDLGEADRIITMLSRNHGTIRAVAKGVRKTRSRFGSRVEPFSMVDVQLYRGKTLDVVTQVEIINHYGREIVKDYRLYTAASAMLEVAERLQDDDGEPDPRQYLLLHGALHAIATRAHAPELVMNSYFLRALALSGWALSIFECARCGTEGPHSGFNIHAGGSVCDDCRPPGSSTPSVETLQLLGALSVGDWSIADASTSQPRKSAQGIVSAFLQWQLEKQVRALRLVESR